MSAAISDHYLMKIRINIIAFFVIGFGLCTGGCMGTGARIKNGVIMENGHLMTMKDGNTMALSSDVMMYNGTKVMMDGTVMTIDYKTIIMNDADMMNLDGKIIRAEGKPHN